MLVDYTSDSEGEDSLSKPTSLTTTQAKTKKAPKKIAISMPSASASLPETTSNDETEQPRPLKKARYDSKGSGSSSLFSLLPAPKVKDIPSAKPQRVLGGGVGRGLESAPRSVSAAQKDPRSELDPLGNSDTKSSSSIAFLPASLGQGKANISLDEISVKAPAKKPQSTPQTVDFFSLGTGEPHASAASITSRNAPRISSAPKVEDYVAPEPTPTDEYPGYYQLPSGTWAQYEPEYYQSFYKKWKADYDAQVRALEKGTERGFEGADDDNVAEVNAQKEMERAQYEIQELEERKKLTTGGNSKSEGPRMNIQGSKLGKGARTRHQLTTLLVDAYANREALEAKIAEGKRNRKEAGNKYGF